MPHLSPITQITFADVLKRLTRIPRLCSPHDVKRSPRVSNPLPDMRGGESHRLYAIHILAGVPHKTVCQGLNIKPRTAEDWRSDLQRSVSQYLGRDVDYHFAARFLLDAELRKICEGFQTPN